MQVSLANHIQVRPTDRLGIIIDYLLRALLSGNGLKLTTLKDVFIDLFQWEMDDGSLQHWVREEKVGLVG